MKQLFFLFLFLLYFGFNLDAYSQQNYPQVSSALLERFEYKEPAKRPFMDMSKYRGIQKANPFIYLSAGMLFFYQRMVSEQIQAQCNYHYSCSSFMKMSISKHGFIKGSLQGMDQWNSCLPSVRLDHAPYTLQGERILNDVE
jgi:putative component of membrane protein insertase Oxa1/YidC/SpoIIIJ protein YidD